MLSQLKFPNNISLIFGSPATGKTTLCLQKAAHTKGKIIFIDTENSFTPERLLQINPETNLDNIILIQPKRYSEQFKTVKSLKDMKNISLVIIDSFTHYYRKKVQEKIVITPPTIRQLQMLRELKIPVILTSQVYTNQKSQNLPLAGHLWKNFSKYTIELTKEPRTLKTNNKELPFKITAEGLQPILKV
ncbi:AAA family ATPase [archaeon]|jgi:RecA/RadA recombinase|nr:AAA family ATPase [archaeon]MBT4417534.1 AAA family ATPase [archaeon]